MITIRSMNHDELCRKNYVEPAHCEERINDELAREVARKSDEEKRCDGSDTVDAAPLKLFAITSISHAQLCQKNCVSEKHGEDSLRISWLANLLVMQTRQGNRTVLIISF